MHTAMRAEPYDEPVARPPMQNRVVRVGPIWDEAREVADERGEVLAEEIRKFLERYVKAHKKGKGKR